jgi:hypothetical protein
LGVNFINMCIDQSFCVTLQLIREHA